MRYLGCIPFLLSLALPGFGLAAPFDCPMAMDVNNFILDHYREEVRVYRNKDENVSLAIACEYQKDKEPLASTVQKFAKQGFVVTKQGEKGFTTKIKKGPISSVLFVIQDHGVLFELALSAKNENHLETAQKNLKAQFPWIL